MTKECKKAQGVVLIPLVILIAILLLASSCATPHCVSNNWATNCPAYR